MFLYTFIAACVLNICRSCIKIPNSPFILLSGCCDVTIKETGARTALKETSPHQCSAGSHISNLCVQQVRYWVGWGRDICFQSQLFICVCARDKPPPHLNTVLIALRYNGTRRQILFEQNLVCSLEPLLCSPTRKLLCC